MRPLPLLLLSLACRPDPVDGTCDPTALPDIDPVSTLTATVVLDPALPVTSDLNPATPEGLLAAEEAGLGGWSEGPGEPRLRRDDLAPGMGTGERRSLALILHQSDAQIADAEAALTPAQGDRIARAADYWLSRHPVYLERQVGLDAVLIVPRRWPRHIPNALDRM